MLESILLGKTKKRKFLRASLLTSLAALSLSCGKDKPTQSGSGSGTGSTASQAHYQSTSKTNSLGIAQVSVKNFDLSTKITNESNQPLQGIDVALVDQGQCYRLISVDLKEQPLYTSASTFIPLSRLTKPIAESTSEGPDLNLIMYQFFEGQPRLFENKLVNVKPGDKRSKDSRKITTTPLANVYQVFAQNDALVKNSGIVEFILDKSGSALKIPELQFASTLNKERTKYLNNMASIQSRVMSVLSQAYGKEYDIWAHYLDIYSTPTPLGTVLSIQESDEKFCTLRLNMFVEGGGQRIPAYTATRLKGMNVAHDKSGTTAFYYQLQEGLYTITITEPGFKNISKEIILRTATPPFFKSTTVDLQVILDPEGISNPRRRIIQTYYESGQAAVWFDFESNTYVKASGEIPPSSLHDLYIEPQDPEISSPDLISNRIKNIALVGSVPLNQIKNGSAYRLVSGYYSGKDSEGRDAIWGPGSSFVVKTREGNWAKFMVESLERENHKMIITYQITGNSNGIFRY